MKYTQKQKDFVKECGDHAADILLLNSYGRTFDWYEEGALKAEKHCSVAATMETDLKYKELCISIYPVLFEQSESKQFEIIFHEFCHAITEHQYIVSVNLRDEEMVMTREIEFAREHETSLVEKAFVWMLADPIRYKKSADFIKGLSREKES